MFFGFNSSIYETLREDYTDKYEYIYPDITVDKNLFSSNKFGKLDLQSNYQVKKYETSKKMEKKIPKIFPKIFGIFLLI